MADVSREAHQDNAVVLLSDMLAMPLTALAKSESAAARTLVTFIKEYGFEPPPSGAPEGELGALRTLTFTCETVDAQGRPSPRQITLPLLSLVTLPTLSIREAKLDFGMEVMGVHMHSPDDASDTTGAASSDAVKTGVPTMPAQELKVRMSQDRKKPGSERNTTKSDIHWQITMEQSDLPIGVLSLVNRLPETITIRPLARPSLAGWVVEPGKSPLRQGESVEIQFRLLDEKGVGIRGQKISVDAVVSDTFAIAPGSLDTDKNGEARTTVTLLVSPATRTLAALVGAATIEVADPRLEKSAQSVQLATNISLDIVPDDEPRP